MDPMAIVSGLNVKRMAPGSRKAMGSNSTQKAGHKKIVVKAVEVSRDEVVVAVASNKTNVKGRSGNESNGIGGIFIYLFFHAFHLLLFSTLTHFILPPPNLPSEINLFDTETGHDNAAVATVEPLPATKTKGESIGGPAAGRTMDLIFSSGSTQQQQIKYQKHHQKPMVQEGMRAPGREFLRSISSVATSPVSQLQGGLTVMSHDEKAPLPKMSKKELKLAQNQLNKLTQINIHLHGKRR